MPLLVTIHNSRLLVKVGRIKGRPDLALMPRIFVKSIKGYIKPGHKYIKREGQPGNYKYTYPGEIEGKQLSPVTPISLEIRDDLKNSLVVAFDFKWDDPEWKKLKDVVKASGASFGVNGIKQWTLRVTAIPKLMDRISEIAISEEGRNFFETYMKGLKEKKEEQKADLAKLSQEVKDFKPNVLGMTTEQINAAPFLSDWLKGFMRSNQGKDYSKLSLKQQRVIDEVQEKFELYLQQNPKDKQQYYDNWVQSVGEKAKKQFEKEKATNELLAEKSNDKLTLPEWVKKDNFTTKDLWGYQKKGVNWLLKVKVGVLGHDVGLGKTIQAITASQMIEDKNKCTVVIVPKARLYGWKNEIEKFTDKKAVVLAGTPAEREQRYKDAQNADFVICTYGMLQREPDKLQGLKPGVVIVDEAHRLKGYDTLQSKNFDEYLFKTSHKYFLTATPMPNRPEELFQIMKHIKPEVLGNYWKDFIKNYCVTEEVRIGRGRTINKIVGYKNKEELRAKVAPYIFVKKQDDEDVNLQLPPKRAPQLTLDMTDEQRRVYKAMQNDAVEYLAGIDPEKFGSSERANLLTKILRLEQIAISPKIIDPAWKGTSPKIEEVKQLIQDHFTNGEKRGVVVFSHFLSAIDLLKAEFKNDGIAESEIATIKGQVSAKEIQNIEDGLNNGQYKILLSSDAGKEGLNLQKNANLMIHLDTPWTPYILTQREGRIYRQGQQSPVTIYRPMMNDSVEQYKQQVLETKQGWIDAIVNDKDTGDEGQKLKFDDFAKMLGMSTEQIKTFKKKKSTKIKTKRAENE